MNRPNLTQLSKEIDEANKLKGWHEQEYSNEHYLCLVISELMEAVEADRKGRRADLDRFNRAMEIGVNVTDDVDYYNAVSFEKSIKDTIEDELADAVIRLLDLAGVRGWDVIDTESQNVCLIVYKDMSFTEQIDDIVSVRYYSNTDEIVSIMIKRIELLCQHLSIDLWLHVELKLKYNLTRPYKHGKEY